MQTRWQFGCVHVAEWRMVLTCFAQAEQDFATAIAEPPTVAGLSFERGLVHSQM